MGSYSELKGCLPGLYDDITEMQAYLEGLGSQLDAVVIKSTRMRNNNFLFLADVATIARLETFLGITADATRTLDDRRKLIASYYTGSGKFGATEIKNIVSVFTDSPCAVSFTGSTITVTVTRDIADTFILNDCTAVLSKKIPAHLALVVTVVSPFSLNAYFGGAVTQYKEEVIS